MRSSLALLVLLVVILAQGSGMSLKVVPASEILANISRGETIKYQGVIIKGDLKLDGLGLPVKQVDRTDDEIRELGLSKRVKLVRPAIWLEYCVVDGNTYFNDTSFDLVFFWGTHFNGTADFRGSIFRDTAYFRTTQFNGTADFRGSQLYDADFLIASFMSDALFNHSHFIGASNMYITRDAGDFSNSWFNGIADFSDSQFENGYANFVGSKFKSSARFCDSQFKTGGTFIGAKFWNYTDFSGSQFDFGDFSSSQFKSDVNFKDSHFNSTADFKNSQFNGTNTHFKATRFGGTANFSGSQFNGTADFRNSQFNGMAEFSGLQFNSYVDFGNSGFNDKLYFRDISFKDLSYNNLNIDWFSIRNHDLFVSDRSGYIPLLKRFKDIEDSQAEDDCYYRYRNWMLFSSDQNWIKRFADLMLLITCGYGVKPLNTILSSFGIILLFGLIYWKKGIIQRQGYQDISRRDAIFYSASIFFTLHPTSSWSYDDRWRYLIIFEDILGWILMTLFVVTMGRVMLT